MDPDFEIGEIILVGIPNLEVNKNSICTYPFQHDDTIGQRRHIFRVSKAYAVRLAAMIDGAYLSPHLLERMKQEALMKSTALNVESSVNLPENEAFLSFFKDDLSEAAKLHSRTYYDVSCLNCGVPQNLTCGIETAGIRNFIDVFAELGVEMRALSKKNKVVDVMILSRAMVDSNGRYCEVNVNVSLKTAGRWKGRHSLSFHIHKTRPGVDFSEHDKHALVVIAADRENPTKFFVIDAHAVYGSKEVYRKGEFSWHPDYPPDCVTVCHDLRNQDDKIKFFNAIIRYVNEARAADKPLFTGLPVIPAPVVEEVPRIPRPSRGKNLSYLLCCV